MARQVSQVSKETHTVTAQKSMAVLEETNCGDSPSSLKDSVFALLYKPELLSETVITELGLLHVVSTVEFLLPIQVAVWILDHLR